MKLKTAIIEMTFPELRALGKLLGGMPRDAEDTIGLTDAESLLLDEMFDEVDEILKIPVASVPEEPS